MHPLCKKNAFVSIRTWFISVYLFVPGLFNHCLTALTRGWGRALSDFDEWIFITEFLLGPILGCFHREGQLPALRPPHTAQTLPRLQWPWEELTPVIYMALVIAVCSVMENPSFSSAGLSLATCGWLEIWCLFTEHRQEKLPRGPSLASPLCGKTPLSQPLPAAAGA